jgi:nitroreductase
MTFAAEPVDPLDVIEDLATRRRTNLQVDPGRPVPDALLDRLIAIAGTAPNHKRTFPWRFRIVTGDGRARLGAALATDLEAGGEPEYKAIKARGKYLRAPVVLAIASRAADNEELTKENRDAVSAAIQNLLLAATAAGLASYWSTGAAMHSDRLRSVCEMDETDTMVGLVYIGWPVGEAPPIDRPAPEVLRIS